MKESKVYLVGAGPGDPGLITVKGLECLKQADVIIYDHLLDEQLVAQASPEAEKIYVGKTARQHVMEQDEINQLLVDKAKPGKIVVRLKGGDPFVLGRGGEEAEALQQNHIPFEVVPGVSSAIAVPAYAGIPLTHRRLASSFAVITGHEDPNKAISSIAWEKLATAIDTLVFLMGRQNLAKIVDKLVENGRPQNTPVAVISDGTSPRQQTVTGTLADIAGRVAGQGLTPPAVIVVGEVVKLREKLGWFDNRPLFGKRVLVTRARSQASVLSRLLAEHGALPIELPAIEIQAMDNTEEIDHAISILKTYHWVVFTSVNGVEAFFGRLYALKKDARALDCLKVIAIGPATAKALEVRGIIADFLPQVQTTDGILEMLKSHDITGKCFLLPRADIADKELVQGISRLGAGVDEIAVYKTIPTPHTLSAARKLLTAGEIDVITFTSSSTVDNLVAAFRGDTPNLNGAKVACIGPKTADTAVKAGLRVDVIAREYTIPGLVTALEEYFRRKV